MALPANHLSFLFLLVLIFSTQIQARESKFFSKFNHYQQLNTTINGTANIATTTTTTTTGNGNTMNSTTANTSTTTTPSSESLKETELPQEQVPSGKQVEEQNSHGYGLYGSNQIPPTTAKTSQEYTYANTPNKTSTEYTGGGYEEEVTTGYENDNKNNYGYMPKQFGMSDTRFMDNANVYNNNGYNNNQYETSFPENGSNGAKTKQLGMSDTRFLDNNDINNNKDLGEEQYSSSYTGVQETDNNGFETKKFGPGDSKFLANYNGYETKQYKTSANKNGDNLSGVKQQGASDTRFMENGKYFYNVNNENSYLNDYQPESRSYDGFSLSQRVDAKNNNNHGNNENAYEFNNSMGESQYQDEENQEEFLP